MSATLDRLMEWPGISRRARIAREIRGGGGTPVYNFTHYRFRSGDTVGLNVDSGWIAAEDTDTGFTLEIGKVYRIRIKISETGDKGSNNQPIHIQARHNEVGAPNWQDVNVCGNGTQEGPVQMWLSGQYTDGAATSELLTNDGDTFLAGTGSEDNAEVTSIDASETELEYCFQIMSSYQGYQIVEPGDTIDFRMVLGAIGSSTAFTGTENIPTVTVAASTAGYIGGCYVEGPNRIGPFCDSNGNLYTITEYAETANDVVMWKSTDGGDSWAAQDVLNRPTESDWECADVWQEGDTLYILLSTGSISFHSFRMSDHPTNPDTWDITDEDVDSTIAGHTSQSGALVRRSDGTFVALYQDDSTPDRIRYKIRSSGGSWGSQQTIDTEASVDFTGVRAVLGASDTTHVFYKDDTNGILYWRTLSSGDSLSGRTALYSSLEVAGTHDDMPILPPVYWDDGGTSKVLVCFQVAENGNVRSVLITGGTPASDVAAFDNTVATDAGSSHMYQATLTIDPATNVSYGLYANAATESLYRAEYDPSTGWGSDNLEDSSQDYHWVCASVFTHSSGNGGAKVLGWAVDWGSGGGTGRVYYGEYEIPTAGQTIPVSPAVASWDSIPVSSSVGALSKAVTPASAAWEGVTVSPAFGGTSQAVSPSAGAWQTVTVSSSIGELTKALLAAVGTWEGVPISPAFGGIAQPVSPALATWQGVPVSAAFGAIAQAVAAAVGTWNAIAVGISTGASVAVSPAVANWNAVPIGIAVGGINLALGPAAGTWQAVAVNVSPGAISNAVGPSPGVWQGITVAPAVGAIVQALTAAQGLWASVAPGIALGGIVQVLGPSSGVWAAVVVTPSSGGQNIPVGPAAGSWEGVAISPAFGSISQALSPSTGVWQAVVVTPLSGGQFLAVLPAVGTWQGVTPGSSTGPVSIGLQPAGGTWQAPPVNPLTGAIAQPVSPSGGRWDAVPVTPLPGALVQTIGAAIGVWQAVAVPGTVGPLIVTVDTTTGRWIAIALGIAGGGFTPSWILERTISLRVTEERTLTLRALEARTINLRAVLTRTPVNSED